jgi:SAM-dependent methyltransferase
LAILSDPSKTGRRWDLRNFLATGRREVSLLMYQLRSLGIDVRRDAALDFGCGIGRLSQPLASHFDRVVGVDISPEMIKLANEINQHPERVRYVCNIRGDLDVLESGKFTFMYSNVVLQHIEPVLAMRYLNELFRVVGPHGVLVFQLPSHRRPPEEQRPLSMPMAEGAYRAAIRVETDPLRVGAPGTIVDLVVSITNASEQIWSQPATGPIRLGNHWLARAGDTQLIQDDGRSALPSTVAPGETCLVPLSVTLPPEAGDYQLECDLVHEGISWFADKGSRTWRCHVSVTGSARVDPRDEAGEPARAEQTLSLPDVSSVEPPGPLPMHGIHHDVVLRLIREEGATLVHEEIDERGGPEWIGYRYFVKKSG